jgi:formylglycine-generating enzyme required for sulfatase activity/tRNA A-37 threonylcarbamoyl transferase component Bud32
MMSGLNVLQPGVIFAGDYRIVRPLKEGGMGAVYVAEQLSTSAQRALKVIQPDLVEDAVVRKRFEREARVGAQIKSDFVVTVMQAGFDEPTQLPWLAMELLHGQDLEAAITEKTSLSPVDTIEIFEQLCDAVGAAHRVGVIHRDLKPENIFLATPRRRKDRFHVKVLDFGIARILAEAQTTSSKTRHMLGTPLFMSPEQAKPSSTIDQRTDVWALGLIAFRMLVGRHFWRAAYDPNATLLMLTAEAYYEPLPAASARAADWGSPHVLSPAFDAWFARCLSRDLEGRFASVEETLAALVRVYADSSPGVERSAQVAFAATLPQTQPPDAPPLRSKNAPGGMPLPQVPAATKAAAGPAIRAAQDVPKAGVPAKAFSAATDSPAAAVVPKAGHALPMQRIAMTAIRGGTFFMGSAENDALSKSDERPRRRVEITTFFIGTYPVTQRLYRQVMGTNPSRPVGDELPVNLVSFLDAIEFCNRLSERSGIIPAYRVDGKALKWNQDANGYRLPTEAEWEFAARGSDGRIYPWGNEAPSSQVAWNNSPLARKGPSPVGYYPSGASPFGLLDMAGNVWEWCWDWYGDYTFTPHQNSDPPGPSSGSRRVLRGGSWQVADAPRLRAAARYCLPPDQKKVDIGFRCARRLFQGAGLL